MQPNYEPVSREAFSISEVCNATSLGRTKIYKAIAEGRLKARKDGKRTIILTDDLRTYLTALPPVYDEACAVAAAAAAAAQSLVLPAPAPANESTAEISVPAEARQAGTKSKTKPPEKKPARKRRQALAEHEHETEMTS